METDGRLPARKHVRALLVTQEPASASAWSAAAGDDLEIDAHRAATIADALVAIRAEAFDVAIVTTSLPDGSHRDALRAFQHEFGDRLPVVVVGALHRDAMRDALALGAIDVVAPVDLARLGPTIARALRDAVVGALLRRARMEAALLDEALRRISDDIAIVAVQDDGAVVVHATRRDLVGRSLGELPFVRDAEEAEELAAAVGSLRSAQLSIASGEIAVEPFFTPLHDRRYAALTLRRGLRASEERDSLTGLPQRPAFERRAQAALADAERDGTSVAVLFLDVDRFRAVNEIADHATGDGILREVAARLRAALPDGYVARFGGDEFVVLREADTQGAAQAAVDAMLRTFAEPYTVAGAPVFLTASIGVALAPDDAANVAGLVGAAEAAVFEAKRMGRNCVRWYAAPNESTTIERVMTRRDLQGAIERDEFELHYQPMYDIETRAILGVEALIRWRHPTQGLVPPDRFIPVAEECGLIDAIGAWVLDRAVAQVRAWDDAGIPAVRVSVNVSARQLETASLSSLVATTLARHRVAASCLELEITESSIMRDVGAAATLLRELRALGVRVSIDDFGTGYTSLGFLKRFPVDVLKIDRTFVADVADGAFDGAVIRAVTTLARALGVRTVAEGVEAPEQLERLRALDCDVVQGFLFSHPLPADACTPLLAGALIAQAGRLPAPPNRGWSPTPR